ncbi:MAG TPA: transposase [Thermoanaerobaculia bacterium]|nr:transposase [Thermoanaerobaculia bacterium]
MNRVIRVRSRWSLPHWESADGTYFVTFRLHDSLPSHVVDALASLPKAVTFPPGSLQEHAELARLRFIETHLDMGLGECWLKRPGIAEIVAGALTYFDKERYELDGWCVMPNHVHVIVKPFGDLDAVIHSWKSFTAHEANRVLGRAGAFWQREYFDHLIREENDLARVRRYIAMNPTKAGLNDWKWCSAGVSPAFEGRRDGGATP